MSVTIGEKLKYAISNTPRSVSQQSLDAKFKYLKSSSRGLPWHVISIVALTTYNQPSSITHLWSSICSSFLSSPPSVSQSQSQSQSHPRSQGAMTERGTKENTEDPAKIQMAEELREAILKSTAFIGIPRVINNSSALFTAQTPSFRRLLSRTPRRHLDPNTILATNNSGRALWDSIYTTVSTRLIGKLAAYHPDMPEHIISAHYGQNLSHTSVLGRRDTSLVGVAALRAEDDAEPQLMSHVLGALRGGCSEDDLIWVLGAVDLLRPNSGPRAKL